MAAESVFSYREWNFTFQTFDDSSCSDSGGGKREHKSSDAEGAPETRGVAVELLTTVDLGPEIQGMASPAADAPDSQATGPGESRVRGGFPEFPTDRSTIK